MESSKLGKIWDRIEKLGKEVKELSISTSSEMLLAEGNKYSNLLLTMKKWVKENKSELSNKQLEVTTNKISQFEKEIFHKKDILKKFNGKEPKAVAILQIKEQAKDIAITSSTSSEFKEKLVKLYIDFIQEKFEKGVLNKEIDEPIIKEIFKNTENLFALTMSFTN